MSERPNHPAGCQCNRCHWADVESFKQQITTLESQLAAARAEAGELEEALGCAVKMIYGTFDMPVYQQCDSRLRELLHSRKARRSRKKPE